VERGLISNYRITKKDIYRSEDIFGPNIRSLKDKITFKTPSRVIVNALDNLPKGINRIPLIVMTSRAIHFGVVEIIKDEKKAAIIKSLQQVINTYQTYTHRQAI